MKLKIRLSLESILRELEDEECMDEITCTWDGEFSTLRGPADDMIYMLTELANTVNLDDVISDEM